MAGTILRSLLDDISLQIPSSLDPYWFCDNVVFSLNKQGEYDIVARTNCGNYFVYKHPEMGIFSITGPCGVVT